MLRRQLGWLQESGIELTTEHFQLDHFYRKSVKPRRYGRKNCPSPTTTYGILGLPLEIALVSSSVIKEWFSMISNFFLILRSYESALEKERGRFQSLARVEAQIHLVCEIDKRPLPPKSTLTILLEGQCLPCLVYAHCFNDNSFYEKKLKIQITLA